MEELGQRERGDEDKMTKYVEQPTQLYPEVLFSWHLEVQSLLPNSLKTKMKKDNRNEKWHHN